MDPGADVEGRVSGLEEGLVEARVGSVVIWLRHADITVYISKPGGNYKGNPTSVMRCSRPYSVYTIRLGSQIFRSLTRYGTRSMETATGFQQRKVTSSREP